MGMADSGLTAEQYQEAWRERTERMERDRQRDERAQRQERQGNQR